MSRTQPTDSEWASMQFACSTCRASRGQWCETVRGRAPFMGNPARWLHNARWLAVREVVRLSGWEGYLDTQRTWARELRRQNAALRGGLTALHDELEQIADRYREGVEPRPLVHRITKILDSAKEQQ